MFPLLTSSKLVAAGNRFATLGSPWFDKSGPRRAVSFSGLVEHGTFRTGSLVASQVQTHRADFATDHRATPEKAFSLRAYFQLVGRFNPVYLEVGDACKDQHGEPCDITVFFVV